MPCCGQGERHIPQVEERPGLVCEPVEGDRPAPKIIAELRGLRDIEFKADPTHFPPLGRRSF